MWSSLHCSDFEIAEKRLYFGTKTTSLACSQLYWPKANEQNGHSRSYLAVNSLQD